MISAAVAKYFFDTRQRVVCFVETKAPVPCNLTKTETQVVELLVNGGNNIPRLAAALEVSDHVVIQHLRNARRRLGIEPSARQPRIKGQGRGTGFFVGKQITDAFEATPFPPCRFQDTCLLAKNCRLKVT